MASTIDNQAQPSASPPRLIVDGHSTLLVPSVQQEEAKIGCAPILGSQPPSHRSHCFEERREGFWQGALRQGDTQSASGRCAVLAGRGAKIPARVCWRMTHAHIRVF